MVLMYFFAVKQAALPLIWWFGWLFCLAIAISLQLTIVFHLVRFY
jgi:hypothetical protein